MLPIVQLSEPDLEFRYGQRAANPRWGLSLFGPYDADSPAHITSISYGLVGTHQGAESFLRFAETLRGPIVRELNTKKPALWTAFPGFDVAFACNLPTTASVTEELDAEKLASVVNQGDANKRAFGVVDEYPGGNSANDWW